MAERRNNYGLSDGLLDAYSIADATGLLGSTAVDSSIPAWLESAYAQAPTVTPGMSPLSGGATTTGGSSFLGGFGSSGATAGQIASGVGALAAPLLMGLTGGGLAYPTPDGAKRIAANRRGQQFGIDAFHNDIEAKYGMSFEDWVKANERPPSPVQQAERLVGTGRGDNMDKGDQGYQMQELANDRHLNDVLMPKYWAENDEWFFPDGSRKFQFQEGLDTWNYNLQQGRDGFEPLTEAQRQDAIAKGLNPDGMFDMDAARRNYQPIWGEAGEAVKHGWLDNGRTVDNVGEPGGVIPPTNSPSTGGVLPPADKGIGGVLSDLPQFNIPDRAQWLQANAPKQTYNGQDLYGAVKRYTPHNHFGGR